MASDPVRLARLGAIVVALAASAALPLTAAASATTGPALSVDASSADHHPASPDIYGLNFADTTLGAAISLPVDRWGGNGTDTYNYRLGSSNTGADWYFENVADCFSQEHNWCSGMTKNNVFGYRDFVAKDRGLGASSLITVPMTGYVAKDAPVGHPLTCGYPKSRWGSQDSFDTVPPSATPRTAATNCSGSATRSLAGFTLAVVALSASARVTIERDDAGIAVTLADDGHGGAPNAAGVIGEQMEDRGLLGGGADAVHVVAERQQRVVVAGLSGRRARARSPYRPAGRAPHPAPR